MLRYLGEEFRTSDRDLHLCNSVRESLQNCEEACRHEEKWVRKA